MLKTRRQKINEKISKTLRSKTHIINCSICGKQIEKCISVTKIICDECLIKENKVKICKICGTPYTRQAPRNRFKSNCPYPNVCKHYKVFPSLIKYFGFNKEKLRYDRCY